MITRLVERIGLYHGVPGMGIIHQKVWIKFFLVYTQQQNLLKKLFTADVSSWDACVNYYCTSTLNSYTEEM